MEPVSKNPKLDDHQSFVSKANLSTEFNFDENLYQTQVYKGHLHFRKTKALYWDLIVWEAVRSIGREDADVWLNSIQDITSHKYFVKDPVVESEYDEVSKMMNNHLWVCPHPEAYHKLGYFIIHYPDGQVKETNIEAEVRQHLSIC